MSRDNDMILVDLRPFAHQAGGHTAVLELNKTTICKPFEAREVWFYENEPDSLLEFTPKYLGLTEVTCNMLNGDFCLTATIARDLASQRGLIESDRQIGSCNTPNVLIKKKSRKRCLSPDKSHKKEKLSIIKSDVPSCLEFWSLKCIERQIDRKGFWANNRPQTFILLENLVHAYRKPCLMDLKMGRRQFSADSSAEKKQLLKDRCAHSTSATLGFRINGTQMYKAATDQYCIRDKYVGRELDDQGAINEITDFFHNGYILRKDAIRKIIQKLERLKEALLTCDTLSFYSCSLLLLYDGSLTSLPEVCSSTSGEREFQNIHNANRNGNLDNIEEQLIVDVRLIDFAHVHEQKKSQENIVLLDDTELTGEGQAYDIKNDDTIFFGIEKLLKTLETIIEIDKGNL